MMVIRIEACHGLLHGDVHNSRAKHDDYYGDARMIHEGNTMCGYIVIVVVREALG